MKNRLFVLMVSVVLLISACDTDFDVTSDWEDVTIVYGLLNQNDSVHYVKINKAFLGDGNLLGYASMQDSNEYQVLLDAKLIEMDGSNIVSEIALDTITIYDKEEGVFYYPEQIVYTTGVNNKVFLNSDYTYNLEIENPETGKSVTSTTELVRDFTIVKPSLNSLTDPTIYISDNSNSTVVQWLSSEYSKVSQLRILIQIREIDDEGVEISRTLEWEGFQKEWSDGTDGGETVTRSFDNAEFYELLYDRIPYDDDTAEDKIIERHMDMIDFEITCGAEAFSTYIDINEPSSSLVEYTPDYTNIENGIGVFSSRYQKTRSLEPQKAMKIVLSELEPTLKFVHPDL